jgi:uncharacterized membrane protein YhaH (DUF805 family)
MGRRFLIAISLANLMFFRIWRELLNGKQAYFNKEMPRENFLAVMLSVLILTVAFWLVAEIAARSQSPLLQTLVRWAFLLVVLLSTSYNKLGVTLHRMIGVAGIVVWAALTIVILYLLYRYQKTVAHVLATVLVIASPFVLVTFAQDIWWISAFRKMNFADAQPAPPLPAKHGQRVLWIIFDELDYRQAFEHRDPSVQLPELDRLRAESFSAQNAYPPNRITELSLPSLINGRLIKDVKPIGAGDLAIVYDKAKDQKRWSREPDVFTDARSLGRNVGIVAWYHPYCRILGATVTRCTWEDISLLFGELRRDPALGLAIRDQLADVVNTNWELRRLHLWPGPEELERSEDIDDYRRLMPAVLRDVADPSLDTVFLHLPVPHPVGIYDRATGQLTVDRHNGYLDNLVLTDRTFGDIRKAMEQAGVWDSTTVIVSADHWWRSDFWRTHSGWTHRDDAAAEVIDHRIPFIVKFAGQTTGAAYAPQWNTVLTRELIAEIEIGNVKDAASLATWLDRNKGYGESPYNKDFH